MSEEELQIVVNMLIANHGDQAAQIVSHMIDRCHEHGEGDLVAMWEQVSPLVLRRLQAA